MNIIGVKPKPNLALLANAPLDLAARGGSGLLPLLDGDGTGVEDGTAGGNDVGFGDGDGDGG